MNPHHLKVKDMHTISIEFAMVNVKRISKKNECDGINPAWQDKFNSCQRNNNKRQKEKHDTIIPSCKAEMPCPQLQWQHWLADVLQPSSRTSHHFQEHPHNYRWRQPGHFSKMKFIKQNHLAISKIYLLVSEAIQILYLNSTRYWSHVPSRAL